jgi:D-sedoheptulose 7-phosphate isomerase
MAADDQASEVKRTVVDFFRAFSRLLDQIDVDAIERVVARLQRARDSGAMVYVAGNGGSAATASHLVNDLAKATKASCHPPMRVLGLNDNVPLLTALANDEGYERIFSGQLENLARPGDVLVVLSASGSSPNLVRAVALAREREVTTIGFLGFDGGALKDQVDECLWLPTEKGAYGMVESGHVLLCHLLTLSLAQGHPAPADDVS